MSDASTEGAGGQPAPVSERLQSLTEKLENALVRLEEARPFAKLRYQGPVLEISQRVLAQPGGLPLLYELAPRLDRAGVFYGTDWAHPNALLPSLVRHTLECGEAQTVMLDCLSHLRILAVANGAAFHADLPAEQARHFLTQVLALNLDKLFGAPDEAERVRMGPLSVAVRDLLQFLLGHMGLEDILGNLVEEIWRILAQRPLQVNPVKAMVTQIAMALAEGAVGSGEKRLGAERLISALFGPTQATHDDPGLDAYVARIESMDAQTLQQEAYGFARAMHDTGLVSDYHAVFLRWIVEQGHERLVSDALGLSSTGIDVLRCYQTLVHSLIMEAVYPETAQCISGLAMLLEHGTLYSPPVASALWRQIGLRLSESTANALRYAFGDLRPPRVTLLAGVVGVLGHPLGVGQGNNPTCQSARAISMWAYNDPDYLLHIIAQAVRQDSIVMHFEGRPLASDGLQQGLAANAPLDTDPVSVLLVPHLDRIYSEMGRICADRGEDPHRWINPEFHGWWVGRDFRLAVDIGTGKLKDYDDYLNQFYSSYHPFYNGNQPLIHPQPAGLAITDSHARFVGWHAITLIRAALDQNSVMRMYFYNPNNDSGQDWGNRVVVSTQGNGERFGESSLPFEELASRLYIFHADPVEVTGTAEVPVEELKRAKAGAVSSWAADRVPELAAAAQQPI